MCPYDGYYEEFADSEEFAYGRSQALSKLLDDHRREERQKYWSRKSEKDCHRRNDWNWDDDRDPFVDDRCTHYTENLNGGFRAY